MCSCPKIKKIDLQTPKKPYELAEREKNCLFIIRPQSEKNTLQCSGGEKSCAVLRKREKTIYFQTTTEERKKLTRIVAYAARVEEQRPRFNISIAEGE